MPAVKKKSKKRRVVARKNPRKQGFPDEVGYKKPPKSRQFGEPDGNPRHSGAWRKEDTLRYKLEKLINGLDDSELEEVLSDPKTPPGVRRLATLLYKSNYEKPESEWRVWESAMNQAYGLPKQSIEQTNLEPPVPLSPRNAPIGPGLRAEGVGATDEGASEAKTRRSRQTEARNTSAQIAKSAPARTLGGVREKTAACGRSSEPTSKARERSDRPCAKCRVRKAQDGAAEADA